MQDLVKYIRTNKNKDIVELKQQGFLTIFVRGKDGSKEVENINIEKVLHEEEMYENSIFYDKF